MISKQANVSKLAIFVLNQNQTGTEIWRTAVIKATNTNEYWFQNELVPALNKKVQLPVINKAGYIPRSCGINHVVDSPYSLNSFPINLRSNVKQVTAVTT